MEVWKRVEVSKEREPTPERSGRRDEEIDRRGFGVGRLGAGAAVLSYVIRDILY